MNSDHELPPTEIDKKSCSYFFEEGIIDVPNEEISASELEPFVCPWVCTVA